MIPKRDEYLSFLKTAIERLTVSVNFSARTAFSDVGDRAMKLIRRHRVKIDFTL
jgi:hypothetical protein